MVNLPEDGLEVAGLAVAALDTAERHFRTRHSAVAHEALEKLDAAASAGDVSAIIGLEGALKFNGGGHLNHTLFWENLAAKGTSSIKAGGALEAAINESFGGVEEMKKEPLKVDAQVMGEEALLQQML